MYSTSSIARILFRKNHMAYTRIIRRTLWSNREQRISSSHFRKDTDITHGDQFLIHRQGLLLASLSAITFASSMTLTCQNIKREPATLPTTPKAEESDTSYRVFRMRSAYHVMRVKVQHCQRDQGNFHCYDRTEGLYARYTPQNAVETARYLLTKKRAFTRLNLASQMCCFCKGQLKLTDDMIEKETTPLGPM